MTATADLRLGAKPAAAVTEEIAPGLVWGVRCSGAAAEPVDGEIAAPGPHEWLWLHFNLADVRAEAWLAASGLLPGAAIARLVAKDDAQQIVPMGDWVAGVFFDLVHDFDRATDDFGLIRFAMTRRLLVTGRRRALSSVEAVRRRLESGQRYASPVDLIIGIVDQIASTIEAMVEELAAEIDQIEDTILKAGIRDDRVRLGRARLTSVRVHRRLNGLRGVFRRLSNGSAEGPAMLLRAAAGPMAQRLDDIDHEVVEIRDRSRLLQEELSARVAEQTNRHLRLLAVLTAVFLPPTLIAGLFGMNLAGAPFTVSPAGFWLAAGVTALSSVATLVGLKWAGVFR